MKQELRERIAHLKKVIEEKDSTIEEQARVIEEWKRGHRIRPKRKAKKKNTGKKNKPGRKKGHPGAQREMPKNIDSEVPRTKDECDDCHGELTPTGNTEEIVVENVIPARVEVERNVLFEYLCQGCGQIHWSELPPEYGERPVPGQPMLGPGVLPMALGLRYDMGLSFHKISRYFRAHVGMKISPSGVYQMIERAATRTKTSIEEIHERALMSAYLNMDETSWWEDGKRLWAWIMTNLDLSYFHIEGSRGHKVIEKLLCEVSDDGKVVAPYEGTVVSDFMGAYLTCDWMVHQLCWVHLLRDADKAAEMAPDLRAEVFRDRLYDIYSDGLIAQSNQDRGKKQGVRIRLGKLVADTELGEHEDVARLQSRAYKEFNGLLHFLDEPEIPAHNNQAEQDIRPLVLFRKVVFGTRSQRGTEVHAHFMSMAQTAKKQGIPLGEYITKALAAYHSGTPPPSIFKD